jgi:hypothetical protein
MSSVWIPVVFIPIVLTELSGWAAWLATKVARSAARRLGESDADVQYADEIAAAVTAVPGPLTRLVAAVGIFAATPALRRVLQCHTRSLSARGHPPDKHRP